MSDRRLAGSPWRLSSGKDYLNKLLNGGECRHDGSFLSHELASSGLTIRDGFLNAG
jgi:hypothetical protein